MYLLCQIPRRYGDISPHFPSILIPKSNIRHIAMLLLCHLTFHMLTMFGKKWLNQGQYPVRSTVHLKRPGYDDEEYFHWRPLPPLLNDHRSIVHSEYNCYKILTGCNEGEEKNFGPDVAYNGGLEFFAGDPPSKKGIWGYHNVRGKKKRAKVWLKKRGSAGGVYKRMWESAQASRCSHSAKVRTGLFGPIVHKGKANIHIT